jgi:hypothetical protein
VLEFVSIFYVCPQSGWFDSFREVSGETVTLTDGSTLSVAGVDAVRFRMWDGRYKGVLCHSVS